jgi:hypothetical protein
MEPTITDRTKTSLSATDRRECFTRKDLGELLNVHPSAISKAIMRGVIPHPPLIRFPNGSFIEAYPKHYVEKFVAACTPTHKLPSKDPQIGGFTEGAE